MRNSNGFISYLYMVLAIIISLILFFSTMKKVDNKLNEVKQTVIKSSFITTVPVR